MGPGALEPGGTIVLWPLPLMVIGAPGDQPRAEHRRSSRVVDVPGVLIVVTNGLGPGGTATGRKAALLAQAGAPAPGSAVANGRALDLKARLATLGWWGNGINARREVGMRG
jgi:hypothetical protein